MSDASQGNPRSVTMRNSLGEVEIDGGGRDARGGTRALSDARDKFFFFADSPHPAACPSKTTGVKMQLSWHREAASRNVCERHLGLVFRVRSVWDKNVGLAVKARSLRNPVGVSSGLEEAPFSLSVAPLPGWPQRRRGRSRCVRDCSLQRMGTKLRGRRIGLGPCRPEGIVCLLGGMGDEGAVGAPSRRGKGSNRRWARRARQ